MKTSTKALVGGAMAASMLFPALAATAAGGYTGFNVNAPVLQGGVLAANQLKLRAAAAGDVEFTFIGGDYRVNARQCRLDHAAGPGSTPYRVTCGSEKRGLSEGIATKLASGSHVAAGKRAYLELHNWEWSLVRVQVKGVWRSN